MSEANRATRKSKVVRHTDLEVYQRAFKAAMHMIRLSKNFPVEERYPLTDQIRRSSRSPRTSPRHGENGAIRVHS